MHPVIGILGIHSSRLVTDQRVHVQIKYGFVIRQRGDPLIAGVYAFIIDIVPLSGTFRSDLHDPLQIDNGIGLQLLQASHYLPVLFQKPFQCSGSHLVDTDHQIDLGELIQLQRLLHGDLSFRRRRHRRVKQLIYGQTLGCIEG